MPYVKAGNIASAIILAAYPKWTASSLTYEIYTALTSFYTPPTGILAVPYADKTSGVKPLYSNVIDTGGLNSVEQATVRSLR